jgi:transcription factor E
MPARKNQKAQKRNSPAENPGKENSEKGRQEAEHRFTDAYLDDFVREIAGRDGLRIVESIEGDGCTDEVIEQKTALKIAEVRCILNHLHSYGVVEYRREKNLQNGWFTYTWNINRERALQNFLLRKRRECDELRQKIAYAGDACTYKCRKGCQNFDFDTAMEARFRCPKCRGMLRHDSNADARKKIEERMMLVQNLLSGFNEAVVRDESAAREVTQLAVAKK